MFTLQGFSQSVLSEFCLLPDEFNIFPNENDFTPEGVGRILISDNNQTFHTTYQTGNRTLQIIVQVPEEFKGEMVYFALVDPDDPSDYEPDTDGGDNPCGSGVLQHQSVRAALYTPFGAILPVAANKLTITDRCSGDNYQIKYALHPPDPQTGQYAENELGVYESIVYTAWKRIYYDEAVMYKQGSFILEDGYLPGGWIEVQDASDFIVGRFIQFEKDGLFRKHRILEINQNRVRIQPASDPGNINRPPIKYDIARDPDLHTEVQDLIDPDAVINPFEGECDQNTTKGVFVEIVRSQAVPIKVPRVRDLLNGSLHLSYSGIYHSSNSYNSQNRILITSITNFSNWTGWNSIGLLSNFIGQQAFISETTSTPTDVMYHEIAHMFGLGLGTLINGHIDKFPSQASPIPIDHTCDDGTDKCLLYYGRNRTDNFAHIEGDDPQSGCAYFIRLKQDKL